MVKLGNGRVALVTGAARGVGLSIAERLASSGFTIVLCDIIADELQNALGAIRKVAPESRSFVCDVADEAAVSSLARSIEAHFGRLDVVVNNAAIIGLVDGKVPTVLETSLKSWEAVLRVNLTGPFLVCRATVPLMRANGWGRIINVGSRSSRQPLGVPAYGTAKTGLVGLSRYLAREVAADGITVNCIAPSRMQTEMTAEVHGPEIVRQKLAEIPIGRLATVQDVAGVAAFLASDDASFITGAVIDVNGGSFMQ